MEILVLGLGWQGKYIKEHCESIGISCAATTTSGRDETIQFSYSDELTVEEFLILPRATMVVITFPFPSVNSGKLIMEKYQKVHQMTPNWILFGSTRPFHGTSGNPWADRSGPVRPDVRFQSEEMFLKMGGCVLNLAGLYGGPRILKNWIPKVVLTKEVLASKTSIHLIHGLDVARLVYAVYKKFSTGQRWLVTDLRIYDWWELVLALDDGERIPWVLDLLKENKTRSLPRPYEMLDRCLDSKETWTYFGLLPTQSLYQQ
jgi:hypothetical protein